VRPRSGRSGRGSLRAPRYPRLVGAPDAIGPVVGWRTWRVRDSGEGLVLASTAFPTPWPRRCPLRARCAARPHSAPTAECVCGVHAAREPGLPIEYLPPHVRASEGFRTPAILGYDTVMALGRVALWGRVVDCEWGWRAELAYPAELLVPAGVKHYRRACGRLAVLDSQALADALASRYGIPVRVTRSVRPAELLELAAA